MRPALLWAAAALGPWAVIRAQCPDGSAPPCHTAAAPAPSTTSVAVLYFDNLSRDTADAYLADGLTEEIIVRLGQIRRLEVKSRYEVQRFRGKPGGDPRTLGGQLGAANIVTGSFQKVGSHVRVSAELVRAANRARIWGEVFDRSSDDVLSIEAEIAGAVVQGVAGQMLPAERTALARRPTQNAQAYDLYLRGRALVSRRDRESLHRAIGLFEEAFAIDSTFAEAEAAAADAWSWIADVFEPPRQSYPQARFAAQRAIRADSSNARAWSVLAAISFFYDWAPARADTLARRALVLDSRTALAYDVRGEALLFMGSLPEGVLALKQAYDYDSLSDNMVMEVVSAVHDARRYVDAQGLVTRYQRAAPGSEFGYMLERMVAINQGDCVRGQALTLRLHSMGALDSASDAYYFHCRGDDAAARRLEASFIEKAQAAGVYLPPIVVAEDLVLFGDREQGLVWLGRALDARETFRPYGPVWDPVRDDPRFKALVQRVVSQLVEQ